MQSLTIIPPEPKRASINTPAFWACANAWAASTIDTTQRAADLIQFIEGWIKRPVTAGVAGPRKCNCTLGKICMACSPGTIGAGQAHADRLEFAADGIYEGLVKRVKELEEGLKFYADRNHFHWHDPDAWDTVSGEPTNFYEDESNTATVEDGSIAKLVLAGSPILTEGAAAIPAWQPVTKPGEVKVGDRLRFNIGGTNFSETVKKVLNPGSDGEEIIYNLRLNYYFITSLAVKSKGGYRNVEFLAIGAAVAGAAT